MLKSCDFFNGSYHGKSPLNNHYLGYVFCPSILNKIHVIYVSEPCNLTKKFCPKEDNKTLVCGFWDFRVFFCHVNPQADKKCRQRVFFLTFVVGGLPRHDGQDHFDP